MSGAPIRTPYWSSEGVGRCDGQAANDRPMSVAASSNAHVVRVREADRGRKQHRARDHRHDALRQCVRGAKGRSQGRGDPPGGQSAAAVPPMSGWPARLKEKRGRRPSFQLAGGYEFDGREKRPFDESAVRKGQRAKYAPAESSAVAISLCILRRMRAETWSERAAAIIREEMPAFPLDHFGIHRANRLPRARERAMIKLLAVGLSGARSCARSTTHCPRLASSALLHRAK